MVAARVRRRLEQSVANSAFTSVANHPLLRDLPTSRGVEKLKYYGCDCTNKGIFDLGIRIRIHSIAMRLLCNFVNVYTQLVDVCQTFTRIWQTIIKR